MLCLVYFILQKNCKGKGTLWCIVLRHPALLWFHSWNVCQKKLHGLPPSLKSRGRQQQVEVVERENNVHAISKLVQAQLSISESFLSPRRSSIPLPKATTVQTHPKPSAIVSYCYTCTHTPKCWKIAQNVSFVNF